MSLDAFSAVLGFIACVESVLGATAVALGIRGVRAPPGPAEEVRRPLLALVAATLVVVALVSFPLHYLLLESWVPRWPGLVCVEGVRRIGTGTVGPSRWLPGLVSALDWTKILMIFAAGSWAVLRRAPGASAARRAALAAVALGLASSLDGAVEFAYVAVPKEEVTATAGCCTISLPGAGRDAGLTPEGAAAGPDRPGGIAAGFVAAAAALGIGSALARRRPAAGPGRTAALGLVAALAAASLPAAARFLAEVAAPAVLGLPFHRCAWCALASAPEAIVGVALHLGAVLSSGWALFAWLPGPPGAGGADPRLARRLLGAASFGFLGTAAMSAVLAFLP